MSVITPKDLAGKSFSSAFKGYNKTEVDEYVSKVTKNYSALYRRCAELEESLAVATVRLENVANDERRAKKTLEAAKEKSDCMIAEAYERADDILVSIKKNCDAILRDFRSKVDAQKDALAEMNARVEIFKKDVFSRYRAHIELLEQLTPQLDFDENYSSNEYVMRVIDDLKHEINAEYDIAIGYDDDDTNGFEGYSEEPDFDEMPTDDEISAFINALAQQGVDDAAALPAPVPADDAKREEKAAQTLEEILAIAKAEEALAAAGIEPAPKPADDEDGNANNADDLNPASAADASGSDAAKAIAPKPEDDPKDEVEKTIIIPSNRRSTRKKKKKQLASVLQMLREYEEEDARNVPKIEAQLMLNLDDAMESLIESPKK
jgi:cell division initiation protein